MFHGIIQTLDRDGGRGYFQRPELRIGPRAGIKISPSAPNGAAEADGERLASESDQSDVYVCPQASRPGNTCLTDELAELGGLDPITLKQRWRVLYRTEAPLHIGQALLLQAVAYRLQERILGGLKSSTRSLLERAAEDNIHRRTPTEAAATKITPGSVLIREWHGVSHRVTVLADSVLLRGARYRSLSEVARKITGTRWSGPQLRTRGHFD
jgi:hypothetical protein